MKKQAVVLLSALIIMAGMGFMSLGVMISISWAGKSSFDFLPALLGLIIGLPTTWLGFCLIKKYAHQMEDTTPETSL